MAYMLKTVTFIVILERNHDILTLICELFVCFKKNLLGHYYDLCKNLTFKQELDQLYLYLLNLCDLAFLPDDL